MDVRSWLVGVKKAERDWLLQSVGNSPYCTEIIRRKADFERLVKSRRRINLSSWLFAKVAQNEVGLRIGWTLPRTVGGAVVRNRIKRWLRNYFANKPPNAGEIRLDAAFFFRGATDRDLKKLTRKELEIEIEKLLGVLQRQP